MIKYLTLYLFLLSQTCLAQSYYFKQHTVEQGLAQSQVMDIAQDRFGNLWFATLGGLSRYDGINYTNYDKRDGLISSEILKVLVDKKGNIWSVSRMGISMFDGQVFHNTSFLESNIEASPTALFEDSEGTIWIGLSKGVCTVRNGALKYYNAANGFEDITVNTVLEDSSGVIWLSSYRRGIYRFQNSAFQKISTLEFQDDISVYTMYNDRSQRLLVGTNKGVWEIKNESFNRVYPILNDIIINSMAEDKHGDLWFTMGSGAGKIENGKYREFREKQGLTNTWLTKIFQDREGTMWFASDGEGVYNFPPPVFTYLNKRLGLNQDVIYTINKDGRGAYWFGTFSNGINSYDGDTIKTYTVEKGDISSNHIRCSEVDKEGNIWFGTEYGLQTYKNGKFIHYCETDGLADNSVRAAFKDSKGVLWFGTRLGLTSYDGQTFINFIPEDYKPGAAETGAEKKDFLVRYIYELPDKILLLSTSRGLYVFNGKEFSEFPVPDLENLFPLTIIGDNHDNLFFGVPNEGIFKLNLTTKKVQKYDVKHGLSSYIIYSLISDEEERLWVGTDRGIDRIVFDPESKIKEIKHFSRNEGFLGIETNGNAVFEDEDKGIWFGSIDGVYKYNKIEDVRNYQQPITYIQNVQLFLENTKWQNYTDSISNWFGIPHNLSLSHQNNHLTFNYFGNSLINPHSVKYQYKLENFDKNWSPVTNNRQAVYANIPPGSYVFKVKSANSDNVWVESPTTLSFVIEAPYWQRWWFYTSVILFTSLLIFIFYKYRINSHKKRIEFIESIKEQEKERARQSMAKDFHDEMGNQLASITVFASLIQMKLNGTTDEIKDIAQNIERSSKKLYSGTKDFIWSMDSKNENTNEVFTYVRDFGEDFFKNSSIRFYAELTGKSYSSHSLTLGSCRQLTLIFKEAMTNALKHSLANNVLFRVKNTENEFEMTLRDDGIGLPEKFDKRGLRNIIERANSIGCTLNVRNKEKGVLLSVRGKYLNVSKKMNLEIDAAKIKNYNTSLRKTSIVRRKQTSNEINDENI